MKTKQAFLCITFFLLGCVLTSTLLFVVKNNEFKSVSRPPIDDLFVFGKVADTHELVNSYFRLGVEATLLAKSKQEQIKRELRQKYPHGAYQTNLEYFNALTGDFWTTSDPRIFDAVLFLERGNLHGLDTNDWSQHDWLLLRN